MRPVPVKLEGPVYKRETILLGNNQRRQVGVNMDWGMDVAKNAMFSAVSIYFFCCYFLHITCAFCCIHCKNFVSFSSLPFPQLFGFCHPCSIPLLITIVHIPYSHINYFHIFFHCFHPSLCRHYNFSRHFSQLRIIFYGLFSVGFQDITSFIMLLSFPRNYVPKPLDSLNSYVILN